MATSGIKVAKNIIITPQIIKSVSKALSGRGNCHFLIFIMHSKSTSGRPIIDRTPETKIYTTILLKYHTHANNIVTPNIINILLHDTFIAEIFFSQTYNKFSLFAITFRDNRIKKLDTTSGYYACEWLTVEVSRGYAVFKKSVWCTMTYERWIKQCLYSTEINIGTAPEEILYIL